MVRVNVMLAFWYIYLGVKSNKDDTLLKIRNRFRGTRGGGQPLRLSHASSSQLFWLLTLSLEADVSLDLVVVSSCSPKSIKEASLTLLSFDPFDLLLRFSFLGSLGRDEGSSSPSSLHPQSSESFLDGFSFGGALGLLPLKGESGLDN